MVNNNKLCYGLEKLLVTHKSAFSSSEIKTILDAIDQIKNDSKPKINVEQLGMSLIRTISKFDISDLGDFLDKL